MTTIKLERASRPAQLTFGLCFLAAACEGFDIQSMGVAAPMLGPALGIAKSQLGPVFSASTLGLLFGALLLGRAGDRFGRKTVLVFSLALFGVFSGLTVAADNLPHLLLIRLAAGLGLGGAMPNVLALPAESTEPVRRERVVTLLTAGYPLGAAAAALVAAAPDWRAIFYVGGLAPLALAAAMALAMRESPGFVAISSGERAPPRPNSFRALFGPYRWLTTLLLWIALFAALLMLYLLLNWLPTLLAAKGASRANANLAQIGFNLAGAAGTMVLALLLSSGGRARLVILWYGGMAAALAYLALAAPPNVIPAAFVAGFFVSTGPLLLYGLAPGCYPLANRATGIGAAVAFGRVGAVVGPLLAPALLGLGLSPAMVLAALSPLSVVAAGATLLLLGRPVIRD
ncbi:MAG TPA: MFS transporter [Caulobacteraceae bacterium]|jgi:AAHS family 3-hydroxyphenylpropionic acid transporter|nr:MFS transporter [Caulobacteraceae bacterium]